jgi:hypothetical protein
MITFTKTDNSVEIDLHGVESHFVSIEAAIIGKVGGTTIKISNILQGGNAKHTFTFNTTDINGRPSDDAQQVAEFLRDTYFSQLVVAVGGGGGGDATAANQTTMITELQDIEADVEASNALLTTIEGKLASSMITEVYNNQLFVYISGGNNDGEIDYISFLLGITEVARLTFTYDVDDNVLTITKT